MSARPRVRATLALALAGALATSAAHAYDPITWRSIDGGGVIAATGGGYRLGGTIGQPDAGTLSGGAFTLHGGFWCGGVGAVVGVPEETPPAVTFRLYATTPNPVRFQSRLAFDLPAPTRVVLSLHDVAGRLRNRVDLGLLPAGPQVRTWQAMDEGGRPLPSGVYFLRLDADRDSGGQKVLVLRQGR